MTFINSAEETRRQAREGKEKGVPANRDPLPPIDGETGKYIDLFANGGSDGNNTNGESEGSGDDGGSGETTETQGAEENTTPSGGSSGGGVTFNGDDPSTFAQEGGGSYTDAGDMDGETTAPDDGDSCIGCDVDKLDGMTEGDCANTGGDSGDCFKIHYDGEFPIPEGWDAAETPPLAEGWVLGKYAKLHGFYGDGVVSYPASTVGPSAGHLFGAYRAHTASELSGWWWVSDDGISGGVGSNQTLSFRAKEVDTWSTLKHINYIVNPNAYCSGSAYENDIDVCPIEQPYQYDGWEDDGCYDLIFDGVTFRGSDYDPNLPDKYKGDGTSSVDYCTDGGKDGATRTATDGGFQIDTTDMRRVYDSDGNLIAAGDKTQSFKEQYEP